MKKYYYCLLIIVYSLLGTQKLALRVEHAQQQKMKLLLCLIEPDKQLQELAVIVTQKLQCPLQKKTGFNVVCQVVPTPNKHLFKTFFNQGFSLVIFLSKENAHEISWRVYEADSATMLAGKKIRLTNHAGLAIADDVWEVLTGQQGIFSSFIAYCQVREKNFKDLYVRRPFDDAQLIVKGGKPLAPRWNNDVGNPMLLYSEATPSNVRLMSVLMNGKRKVISDFQGINMLPSFSPNGYQIVYCMTKNGKSQLYKYSYCPAAKQASLEQVIENNGHNISPNLLANGDIIFCSDFQTGNPQIYYYYAADKKIERITQGGYCTCPHYSEKTKQIVYGKSIKGVMQLFLYDMNNRKEQQLTFDLAQKDECCWSPCGNYIAYTYVRNNVSRIAVLNLITQEQFFITSPKDICSYPAWSPIINTCFLGS